MRATIAPLMLCYALGLLQTQTCFQRLFIHIHFPTDVLSEEGGDSLGGKASHIDGDVVIACVVTRYTGKAFGERLTGFVRLVNLLGGGFLIYTVTECHIFDADVAFSDRIDAFRGSRSRHFLRYASA